MNKLKNKTWYFLTVLFLVMVGAVESAQAELITYYFTGQITSVPDTPPYGLSINIGDPVTGSISYDPSLPPAYDTGQVAGYIQSPPSGMSVVIGGATVLSAGDASLQVLNNSSGVDNFNGYFTAISGQIPPGSLSMVFSLTDTSQKVFSNTDLPDSLSAWRFDVRTGAILPDSGMVSFSIDTLDPLPNISVSPNSHDFGSVIVGNISTPQTFTISNTGTADLVTPDLVIGTITLAGTNPLEFKIQSDNCSGQTLTPTASCTVDVVFEPLSIGSKDANLRIPSNDSDNPNLDVLLNGIGILSFYDQVTLLAPDGEEVIPSGSLYTIYWGPPGGPEALILRFNLAYSLDDRLTWIPILPRDLIGTTYNWIVPKQLGNKKKCFIKVTGYEHGAKVGKDISDKPFTIEVVKVTAPTAGETLTSGTTYPITWKTNGTKGTVSKVKLYYTKNGGVTWNPICDPDTGKCILKGNPGSYDWTVSTGKTKPNCKVKVELINMDGAIIGTDKSDGYFTIGP